jgi:molybdopterin-guanine dinucleotide biosynthesis protein A
MSRVCAAPAAGGDAATETIDVVVLAGGINTIPLYDGYVPGPKALIPYEDKPSIEYVLDALCALPQIGRIVIQGPKALLEKALPERVTENRFTFLEGGATFLESLIVGLTHFRAVPSVLFVTADIPLLTPDAVKEFLRGCKPRTPTREQTVHVAAVPRKFFTGAYRRFTKPFNRFRDIHICHGNLFLADTSLLDNHDLRDKVTRMYDGRKSILSRLAFGWQIALTYLIGVDLLHVLTLRYMAKVASHYLGVQILPVLISDPAVAMDVDEADDYRFVRDRIREQARRVTA